MTSIEARILDRLQDEAHEVTAQDAKIRAELVSGLREFADWLEEKAPIGLAGKITYVFASADGVNDKGKLTETVRAMGKSTKEYFGDSLYVKRSFGDGDRVDFTVTTSRENVCKKIKTGEKIIPAHVEPALPERLVAEHVVEEFEWDCSDPILKADDE